MLETIREYAAERLRQSEEADSIANRHAAYFLALAESANLDQFSLVQGSAYGDEARFLLRPPTALLLGPIPVAWALMAASATGPMLLACGEWVAGAIVCVVGLPLAARSAARPCFENASQASPYALSVGTTTNSPSPSTVLARANPRPRPDESAQS